MPSQDRFLQHKVNEIYQEHHLWLRRWLRPRVACGQLAADLVQDVFVRLLSARNAASSLQQVREPKGYLATIARRLMIDHFRRASLERAWMQAMAEQPEAQDIPPEERAILLETLYELDAMLAGLGEKVRRAFLLSQLDGLTYRAIGETLGVSVITVNRYVAKAVQHCLLYRLRNGC